MDEVCVRVVILQGAVQTDAEVDCFSASRMCYEMYYNSPSISFFTGVIVFQIKIHFLI